MREAVINMNDKNRKLLNIRDTIIIVCIIAVILMCFIIPRLTESTLGEYALITCGGKTAAKLDLDGEGIYTFPEIKGMSFIIDDKRHISVYESDCSDHTCMRTFPISSPGEVIICVPNKVTVEIISELPDENKPDVILR